jgi:eukaryotic translation initiation factor 2C
VDVLLDQESFRPGQIQQNNLLQTVVTRFHEMTIVSGFVAPPPIAPGPLIELDASDATQTNDQLIQSMMQKVTASDKSVGLVYVLLPTADVAAHNRVNYVGDILYGIHTICSLGAKATKEKGRDQYLANIALKVNGKLLGINQSLDMSKLGIIAEGKTMVVGIDVSHPSPGSLSSAPSVAAVVASTDKNLSQFPCELSIQEGRKEMITDLGALFKSRLDLWKSRNKTLPENILVY